MRRMAMVVTGVAMLGAAGAAQADNAMKVCGARYQAARTAKTLPAGQTWNQFLAQCRGTVGGTSAAAAKPAGAKPGAAPSAAMTAMHDRQKKCGAQWQADKTAGKVPAGQTWPKYWSACNARLKG